MPFLLLLFLSYFFYYGHHDTIILIILNYNYSHYGFWYNSVFISSPQWYEVSDTGLNSLNAFVTYEAATAAKQFKSRKPGGRCTSILADPPPTQKKAHSTVFDLPLVHDRDESEPRIRLKVYLAEALLEEPRGKMGAYAVKMVMHRVHMEPFSMRHSAQKTLGWCLNFRHCTLREA